MKLYITKKTSQKTNKTYKALVAVTKAGETIVSFDTMTMLRVSGLPLTVIENLKEGEKIDIE